MKRIDLPERPGWREQAARLGYAFHNVDGVAGWDETKAYVFTQAQIDQDLIKATAELNQMCLAAVDLVTKSEQLLSKLVIPEDYWDLVRRSWQAQDPTLYGRFDFLYDGTGPAKMLEFNADTPTTLYEAGFFQWLWFEEQRALGVVGSEADQFNLIQEKMIARLRAMFAPGCHVHFSSCKDSVEDRGTVEYLEDCAIQASLKNHFVYIEDIGVDKEGRFVDSDEYVIDNLFKLYPLEDMMREKFSPYLKTTPTRLIEPPWKSILSNKGLLAVLWEMFPGHPNLLPSFFENDVRTDDIYSGYVRKPLYSREGENVEIYRPGHKPIQMGGDFSEEGWVIQAYQPAPRFGEDYTILGSWIIGDEPVGIGVREDTCIVTQDLSRFVPHVVLD